MYGGWRGGVGGEGGGSGCVCMCVCVCGGGGGGLLKKYPYSRLTRIF